MLSRALTQLYRECFQELDLERKSALTILSWGVWVIAFRSFGSAAGFYYLIVSARWFVGEAPPEWFWGGLCIAVGTLQLIGIFGGERRLRLGAALFAATLWTCLGTAFCLYNPYGTGALVYGFFALANAALYYQVGTHRRGARGRFNVRLPMTPGGTPP